MLEKGYTLTSDGRQYTVIDMLGRGANTVAYLAECRFGELTTKCILKEYAPADNGATESGKQRFIAAGKRQNEVRQLSALNNQTPPVSHIFEANGTAFIDVTCFGGTTLDKLRELTLLQYMAICLTLAKTVGYYHSSGFICLDLKPENIFIMQNSPDDTVTQLVEFIDFDSVRSSAELAEETAFSYTRDWAAPEQTNPYSHSKISRTADIYTIGEMVFYLLFGRHSNESEHRGFSDYPFEQCKKEFHRFTDRPDIRSLFTRLFRGTLRSSASNRFSDVSDVIKLLEQLVYELERRDYVVPKLPSVSPDFVGREQELKCIAESLHSNPVLYVTGVGGIGKSTLVRNFISRNKAEYDVIVYLEFEGDIQRTFTDDMQLRLSTVSRQNDESTDDYFTRKLTHFKCICGEKRVLFVLDNYSGLLTKELSTIIDCGYDTIIISRSKPPKNSFAFLEVGAITDTEELFKLIALNLERQPTKDERECFAEMIRLVQGHTLVLELIARQIAAGKLSVRTALELIRENGFSRFSEEKVGNYKDGEEVYDTLSAIISALFDASGMTADELLTTKVLSLLDVRGLEADLLYNILQKIREPIVTELTHRGWITSDGRVRVHPVIAETARSWEWSADDVDVMECHKQVIDFYVGMANVEHIRVILREAEAYSEQHCRHIIKAMYYDMLSWYYDVLVAGRYVPYNEEEAELLQNELDTMDMAIAEIEQSSDPRRNKYLTQYYLSLAGILIRSTYDCYDEARELLDKVSELIEENSDNHCYYCMVSAMYYTLAEPDISKTTELTQQAARIAKRVFKTELEIIDIIYIPTANCYFYHNEPQLAAQKLEEAIEICKQNSELLPYVDKQAELLNCLLDVAYRAMEDEQRSRGIIMEIDTINEKYKEQGIYREVNPEIRNELN